MQNGYEEQGSEQVDDEVGAGSRGHAATQELRGVAGQAVKGRKCAAESGDYPAMQSKCYHL